MQVDEAGTVKEVSDEEAVGASEAPENEVDVVSGVSGVAVGMKFVVEVADGASPGCILADGVIEI